MEIWLNSERLFLKTLRIQKRELSICIADNNPQGETLAHILNGVLNRPVRDALLLHQALAETSKDRTELLISRLVRYHWEPRHLERVKSEYYRKYSVRLEKDIEKGTKGDFCNFCLSLCDGPLDPEEEM